MPRYVCEKCGTIDHSACCFAYHAKARQRRRIGSGAPILCSVCEYGDDWHDHFPLEHYDEAVHGPIGFDRALPEAA